MERPRTRTLNQALTRPETVAGAEKMPIGIVVTAGVLFGMLAWWFQSLVSLAVALLAIFVGVPTVRAMGKADPQLTAVYRANLAYRSFYAARSAAHLPDADPGQGSSWVGTLLTTAIALVGAAWLFGSFMFVALAALCLALAGLLRMAGARQASGE